MRENSIIRNVLLFVGLVFILGAFCGCGMEKTKVKKVRNVEFTVIEQSEIPKELLNTMEEKKKEGFKLTYTDEKNLYLAVGYGEQKTGGYSISVDECFLAKNAIYFGTTLTGPQKGERINEVSSYPYIVVKMENIEEPVVFE